MAGVDLYTVQRAGGWKTQTMVQRYAHPSPDHIRAAVERLATSGSATDTKTGTNGTAERRQALEVPGKFGAPGGIRTPDPRLRRPMLYPTELQARAVATIHQQAAQGRPLAIMNRSSSRTHR